MATSAIPSMRLVDHSTASYDRFEPHQHPLARPPSYPRSMPQHTPIPPMQHYSSTPPPPSNYTYSSSHPPSSPNRGYSDPYLPPLSQHHPSPPRDVPTWATAPTPPSGPGGAPPYVSTMHLAPVPSREIAYTDDANTKLNDHVRRRCFNCCTIETSTWRRSNLNRGKVLCNKCGLFERTHQKPRPDQFPHKRTALPPSGQLRSPSSYAPSPSGHPPPPHLASPPQPPHLGPPSHSAQHHPHIAPIQDSPASQPQNLPTLPPIQAYPGGASPGPPGPYYPGGPGQTSGPGGYRLPDLHSWASYDSAPPRPGTGHDTPASTGSPAMSSHELEQPYPPARRHSPPTSSSVRHHPYLPPPSHHSHPSNNSHHPHQLPPLEDRPSYLLPSANIHQRNYSGPGEPDIRTLTPTPSSNRSTPASSLSHLPALGPGGGQMQGGSTTGSGLESRQSPKMDSGRASPAVVSTA